MANKRRMQIRRGTNSAIANASSETPADGQLIFNKDKNYISVGTGLSTPYQLPPITTNRIHGYLSDISTGQEFFLDTSNEYEYGLYPAQLRGGRALYFDFTTRYAGGFADNSDGFIINHIWQGGRYPLFKTEAVNSTFIIHNDPSKSNSDMTQSTLKIQEQKGPFGNIDLLTIEGDTYTGSTLNTTGTITLYKDTDIRQLWKVNNIYMTDLFEYDEDSEMLPIIKNATEATYASSDHTKGTIEERLTNLGFKQGSLVPIMFSSATTNTIKRQGNYCVLEFETSESISITNPFTALNIARFPPNFKPVVNASTSGLTSRLRGSCNIVNTSPAIGGKAVDISFTEDAESGNVYLGITVDNPSTFGTQEIKYLTFSIGYEAQPLIST